MTKRIRAVGLDAFKTAIQQKIYFESPLKEFVTHAWPLQKGEAHKALRRPAMTRPYFSYQSMVLEAERNNIFLENKSDLVMAEYAAEVAMQGHFYIDAYARNPEVDDVKAIAKEHGLGLGVISDLAASFGPIATKFLHDLNPRLYSFETESLKDDQEPFIIFADQLGVDIEEIVFVGDNVKSDYETPKDMGMQAFWYVPDPGAYAAKNGGEKLAQYKNDIVSSLPEIFDKLRERHFTLG